MTPGPVLALDLATKTGFAVGEPGGKPVYGSLRFGPPDSGHGTVCAALITWLIDIFKVHQPVAITYESPLNPFAMKGKTNMATSRLLLSLPFVVEGVAHLRGCYDVEEISVQTVRKHFLGSGRIGKAEGKPLVATECRRMGWEPKDSDASDALAIWYVACRLRQQNAKIRAEAPEARLFA